MSELRSGEGSLVQPELVARAQVDRKARRQTSVIGLDLLRGAAALMVAIVHLRGLTYVEWGALDDASRTLPVKIFFGLTRTGQMPVLTFFVLSGFLVGGQVIRACRAGTFDPTIYVIDRGSRIWLPLIPAVLLTVAVGLVVGDGLPSPQLILGNMIGLNGLLVETLARDGPLWTLSYEIWFYVLAGAIGALFVRRDVVFALVLVVACAAVFLVHNSMFLLIWWVGAGASLLLDIPRKGITALVGLGLFLLGAASWEFGAESRSFATIVLLPLGLAKLLAALGVALTLPWLCDARSNDRLRPLATVAAPLSAISYTLYLVHLPVLSAFERVFPRANHVGGMGLLGLGARAIAVLLVTLVMWMLFERQTAVVRRFLKSRLPCASTLPSG